MKKALALVAIAGLASVATAQTAEVIVTVNGGSNTVVAPGATVTVGVQIAHNQFSVAGIQGGSIIAGNAGTGGNFVTTVPGLPTVNMGAFTGGSRTGVDVAFTPPGFIGGATPPSGNNPMPLFAYEVSGLLPGTYSVNWVSPASAPNVRLYSSVFAFNFLEATTTYTGATITVTPAPASLALVGLGGLVAGRRRR